MSSNTLIWYDLDDDFGHDSNDPDQPAWDRVREDVKNILECPRGRVSVTDYAYQLPGTTPADYELLANLEVLGTPERRDYETSAVQIDYPFEKAVDGKVFVKDGKPVALYVFPSDSQSIVYKVTSRA